MTHFANEVEGKGLKRKAVIDVGSNSIKLLVAEKSPDGVVNIIHEDVTISRLGAGLKGDGPFALSQEAMERNCRVICDYGQLAREHGAERIVVVGTMALRVAENSGEFARRVQEACGLALKVISGPEEAHLAFAAALGSFPLEEHTVIFDIGGGSTEFVYVQDRVITKKISISLGCLGITARYMKPGIMAKPFLDAAFKEIDSVLADSGVEGTPDVLIGSGGTVTTMGAVKHGMVQYNPRVIHGSGLTPADVEGQIALYASLEVAKRRQIPGLPTERVDLILAGACIVRGIMLRLSSDRLVISHGGVRHGMIYELFSHE